MASSSIQKISLSQNIWNMVLDETNKHLYIEIRNEDDQNMQVIQIDLESMTKNLLSSTFDWWNKLVGAEDGFLYVVTYHDKQNPANHSFTQVHASDLTRQEVQELPNWHEKSIHPFVYESDTEYHKTVSDFLSLEQPLSCEYLEWNDKIIISYYVRSENVFDRYLLLLKDGNKEWKVCQDQEMKGFAPGAFFVFENQLIFIQDRNEVCVYTG